MFSSTKLDATKIRSRTCCYIKHYGRRRKAKAPQVTAGEGTSSRPAQRSSASAPRAIGSRWLAPDLRIMPEELVRAVDKALVKLARDRRRWDAQSARH